MTAIALLISGLAIGISIGNVVQGIQAERLWRHLATRVHNLDAPTTTELKPWTYTSVTKETRTIDDDDAPPCPRCGQPCHKVATPTEPGDTSWVWGHDC